MDKLKNKLSVQEFLPILEKLVYRIDNGIYDFPHIVTMRIKKDTGRLEFPYVVFCYDLDINGKVDDYFAQSQNMEEKWKISMELNPVSKR